MAAFDTLPPARRRCLAPKASLYRAGRAGAAALALVLLGACAGLRTDGPSAASQMATARRVLDARIVGCLLQYLHDTGQAGTSVGYHYRNGNLNFTSVEPAVETFLNQCAPLDSGPPLEFSGTVTITDDAVAP